MKHQPVIHIMKRYSLLTGYKPIGGVSPQAFEEAPADAGQEVATDFVDSAGRGGNKSGLEYHSCPLPPIIVGPHLATQCSYNEY